MDVTPPNDVISPSKIYSPVNVPESPHSCQQGQLTGIPRRVRDSAADLFNAIQEWNRLHIEGMRVINDIKNKKLDELEKKNTVSNLYPAGLQELCDKLEEICLKLKSAACKMETVWKSFEGVNKLQEMKRTTRPIFTTWTHDKYARITRSVYEGYEKEVLLKKHVQENISHSASKEDIMLHSALWAHQPYIEKHFDFFIESMLKETGHR